MLTRINTDYKRLPTLPLKTQIKNKRLKGICFTFMKRLFQSKKYPAKLLTNAFVWGIMYKG